jgi:hypothetical protein
MKYGSFLTCLGDSNVGAASADLDRRTEFRRRSRSTVASGDQFANDSNRNFVVSGFEFNKAVLSSTQNSFEFDNATCGWSSRAINLGDDAARVRWSRFCRLSKGEKRADESSRRLILNSAILL